MIFSTQLKIAIVALLAVGTCFAVASPPQYRITFVPRPSVISPGASWVARGINDRGDVVGDFHNEVARKLSGFIFRSGSFTDLGPVGAADINDRGDILRTYTNGVNKDGGETECYGARVDYADGSNVDIVPQGGFYSFTSARRINSQGEAAAYQWRNLVGSGDRYGQTLTLTASGYQPLIYDANGNQIFGPAYGPFWSMNWAEAINDDGKIVGGTGMQRGLTVNAIAFQYQNGFATRLGYGIARAINNAGTVAVVDVANFTAYLRYVDGRQVTLPIEWFSDMNEAEHIVTGQGGRVIWDDRQLYTLNDFLTPEFKSRYDIRGAYSINNRDQIAGMAWDRVTERQYAVRLDPVPEPATWLAMACGAAAITRRRRR